MNVSVEEMEELSKWSKEIDDTLELFNEGLEDYDDEIRGPLDHLLDLRLTLEQIVEQDGVSREMATGLEDLFPDTLNIKSFTRVPTHTNLTTTLEAIDKGTWGWIAMIGVAIAGLIAKIIMWLFDRKTSKPSSKNVETAVKVAEVNQEKEEEKEPEDLRSAAEKVNDVVNAKEWNRFAEMCSMEPDEKMVSLIGLQPFIYSLRPTDKRNLLSQIELLADYIERDADDYTDIKATTGHISSVLEVLAKHMGYSNDDSFAEILLNYREEITELKDQSAKEPFSIEYYNDMMALSDERGGGISTIAKEEREMDIDTAYDRKIEKRLEKIQKLFENLKEKEKERTPSASRPDADFMDKAIDDVREDAIRKANEATRVLARYFTLRHTILATDQKMYKTLEAYRKELS